MNKTEQLKSVIAHQRELIDEMERVCAALERSDTIRENEHLRTQAAEMETELLSLRKKLGAAQEEKAALKNALFEQIYSEKLTILSISARKLDVYFKSNIEGERNRLSALEKSAKERIDQMAQILKSNNIDLKDELYTKLDELSLLLNEKVTKAQADLNSAHGAFSEHARAEIEKLKTEQITDETVKASVKKNNFEAFIGLNLLNKLGIFLIIIGVIVASQYTYFKLSPMLKGIAMFLLGSVMLVAGELLNRKKPNIFSLGLTAGGVAVLYVALAVSYFGLQILSMYPALLLCVLITGVAFVLATRYHAQVVLTFALIGGYLPMFSIGAGSAMVYGAMVYFILLNLLALTIAFQKKWTIAPFIGLSLNIIGAAYISVRMFSLYYNGQGGPLSIAATLLYLLMTFVIYTLIPVVGTYKKKRPFQKPDIVLLALNTFFSCILLYAAFTSFRLEAYNGALAVVLAAVYLLLGWWSEHNIEGERRAQALFYLTGLAFVILVVPLQFGKAWLSLGWLAEAVLLAIYGIVKGDKLFQRCGFSIGGLCLLAFLLIDVPDGLFSYNIFPYQYLAVTLGSTAILAAFIYKKTLSFAFQKAYKYCSLINLWLYVLYLLCNVTLHAVRIHCAPDVFDAAYLLRALAIVVTFVLAYFLPRVRILCDMGVKVIATLQYGVGIIWLYALNHTGSPVGDMTQVPAVYAIIGTAILALVALLSVFAVYDLMRCLVLEQKIKAAWFPLAVSCYLLLILTQNLITQYHLTFSSAALSILYMAAALAWIVFGFARRYALLRRFGLALSILAVAKLFLIDLFGLTKGYQIVSYFSLGITLLIISFVYQYFSKRLERKTEEEHTDDT